MVYLVPCGLCVGFLWVDTWFPDAVPWPEPDLVDTELIGNGVPWVNPWFRVPEPPEAVAHLLWAAPDAVAIETVSGAQLACQESSPYDTNCWVPLEEVTRPEEKLWVSPNGIFDWHPPRQPPQLEIVETVDYEHVTYWFGGDLLVTASIYHLTKDGSLWRWSVDGDGMVERPKLDARRHSAQAWGMLLGWACPMTGLGLLWVGPVARLVGRRLRTLVAGLP
jgi:hypothetical protein